jgi:hypothetical protein
MHDMYGEKIIVLYLCTANHLKWYFWSISDIQHTIVSSVCQVHKLPSSFLIAFVIMKLLCVTHVGWASKWSNFTVGLPPVIRHRDNGASEEVTRKLLVQQITRRLSCESARNCDKDKYVNIRLHTRVVVHTQWRNFRHIIVNRGTWCGVNYFAPGGAFFFRYGNSILCLRFL